jgi:hypothetical protein
MASEVSASGGFWLKWTVVCGVGEFLGIGMAAGLGISFFMLAGEPDTSAKKALAMVVAAVSGIIEGMVVGWLQWLVLRRWFMYMKAGGWLLVTAIGAALAWLLGMTYPTFMADSSEVAGGAEPALALVLVMAAGLGIMLGAVFGFFQWTEMRHFTTGAGWWIVANMAGWLGGMAVLFFGASLPGPETDTGTIIAIGAVSGLVAGLVVGAITGIFLVRLIMPRYTDEIVLG